MKKIYYPFLFVWAVFASCNDYLDVVPDNVATLDHAFVDRMSAEKFLATCYSYMPKHGRLASDPGITGSDETWIHTEASNYSSAFGSYHAYNIKRGRQNVTDPLLNYWDGGYNGTGLFIGIRDCNIFLENIHKVGKDLEDSERARWIAEVKFLKAYYHYYLVRMYGPVPLIRENLPISAGIDEVRVFREPVDACFSYIVQLIDEAVPGLPLEVGAVAADLGHITQPVALAIKAEILVTAASPLFNGNSAYSGFADSEGVQLFNPDYDENKWKLAMDACKSAIDTALLANNRLYVFNDPRYTLSETTALVMSLRNAFAEKWNEEVIWGFTENTTQQLQQYTLPYFALTDQQLTHTSPVLSPTMTAAEMFYTENGVPISEDTGYDYANRYATSAASGQGYYISDGFVTANLNQRREPRFYACLGFDGAIWYGNGRYKDVGQGTSTETPWIVRAKAGEMSGKTSSIRYSATGYFLKKYPHFETATSATAITYVRMAFPVMRLADLYLLYAEARNEYSGPDAEVYQYLDLVRERAGLQGVVESWGQHSRYPDKPLSKEGLREIIHQERTCELAFEGKRFWDLRRWKTADQVMNQVVKGWNVEGTGTADYYSVVSFESLEFRTREYLWPLKQQTLRVNPNLVQNPFWEN